MRCGRAKRELSDDLDGALAGGRKAGLEAHLRSCAGCRAYRDGLIRLQATALPSSARPDEYWAGFEKRLEAKLSGQGRGRSAAGMPFPSRRLLAWAAAAAMVYAAAGIWHALVRRGVPVMEAWVLQDDAIPPFLQEAEADPELGILVDREIQASIAELAPPLDADVAALSATDPLFWEDLSEDELLAVVSALENDTGRGGPK